MDPVPPRVGDKLFGHRLSLSLGPLEKYRYLSHSPVEVVVSYKSNTDIPLTKVGVRFQSEADINLPEVGVYFQEDAEVHQMDVSLRLGSDRDIRNWVLVRALRPFVDIGWSYGTGFCNRNAGLFRVPGEAISRRRRCDTHGERPRTAIASVGASPLWRTTDLGSAVGATPDWYKVERAKLKLLVLRCLINIKLKSYLGEETWTSAWRCSERRECRKGKLA